MRSPETKTTPTWGPASQNTGMATGHASPSAGRQGDGAVSPDEPDDDEFELIGDNDLGAADLGPLGPNAPRPGRRFRTDQENNPGGRARHREVTAPIPRRTASD